jgi:hypothetical protein
MKLNTDDIPHKTPKQLRTLRNQLNNRIGAFDNGKEATLKESHPLFGLDVDECKNLVAIVKRQLKSVK